MTLKIDRILSPFYCQTALRLCLKARTMCAKGECEKVAEICAFVSTLCSQNGFGTCNKESTICGTVAAYCRSGRNSGDCIKAHIACDEAKKMCPQNNGISGG